MHYFEKGKQFALVVNEEFDQLFTKVLDEISANAMGEAQFAKHLESAFAQAQEAWYQEASADLEGKNLSAYLEGLEELEKIEFLRGMAEVLDFSFPSFIQEQIGRLSDDAIDTIISRIEEIPLAPEAHEGRVEDIFFLNQFLPLLAKVNAKHSDRILAWFLSSKEVDDRISDGLTNFVKASDENVQEKVFERISQELESGKAEENASDYLLQAYTAVAKGDEEKRDVFYPLLRRAFLDFEKKQIIAICLGDLGTVRAIPLLRGYIEKNHKEIDRDLYYEILSSIKRLGGSTKDLPDPFQDFQNPGGFDYSSLFGLGG